MAKKPTLFEMDLHTYRNLQSLYGGICLSCGEHIEGDCEPDVEGRHCDSCGKDAVAGIEQALLLGRVAISDPMTRAFEDSLARHGYSKTHARALLDVHKIGILSLSVRLGLPPEAPDSLESAYNILKDPRT
jgi:hypothetical protein